MQGSAALTYRCYTRAESRRSGPVPLTGMVGLSDGRGAGAEETAVRAGADGYRADPKFGLGELDFQEQSRGGN